jgi:protein-S-isoprenylcysteine O-methyltransferase Ste14
VSHLPALGSRGEGWVVLQLIAIGLVIGSASYGRDVPPAEPVGWLLRNGGLALVVAGGALLFWGYVELQRARTFSIMPRPIAGGVLVESGPYRLVRNPIYSGLVVGSLGIAAARNSVLTLLAAVVLLVVLDLKRRREEVWLAARFPAYEAYRRRTKALIPFFY